MSNTALGGAKTPPSEGRVEQTLSSPDAPESNDEDRAGLPADAPEELIDAAHGEVAEQGDPEGDREEATVLSYLLGPTTPLEYDVVAMLDTPTGQQKLVFHIRQLDDTKIEELEEQWTEGVGPMRRVDRKMLNAAKVAAATVHIEDADGNKVELNSREFRGPVPDAIDAVRTRFKYQPGILSSVAMEIDAVAGLLNDRVGQAKRAPAASDTIATAVGNS